MEKAFIARMIGGGSKNLLLQVQGQCETNFVEGWKPVFNMKQLKHPANYLRLDAVHYAISEGLELQIAWSNSDEIEIICPLAGRGKLDFDQISGVHSFLERPLEEIVVRVLGEAKNGFPSFLLMIDLSLHQGAL